MVLGKKGRTINVIDSTQMKGIWFGYRTPQPGSAFVPEADSSRHCGKPLCPLGTRLSIELLLHSKAAKLVALPSQFLLAGNVRMRYLA